MLPPHWPQRGTDQTMLDAVVRRLLISIPVIIGVLLIGFLLLQVIPTDPAVVLAGPMAPPEVVEKITEQMGLNRPVWEQFLLYLGRVVQGDLGRSIISNTPVIEELGRTIGPTVELLIGSLVWSVPAGIALGATGAVHRGRLIDKVVMAISVAGVSVPIFWIGLILMQYLAYNWGIFPVQGRGGPIWTLEGLAHLVLPSLTLGAIFVGPVARMTRTTMLEVLDSEYVRTARAKGLQELRVLVFHALRTSLLPVITLIGLMIGFLLGGAVVTETIFTWPGVGRMAVGAILSSDYPLAQGAILLLAVSFIVINLIVDLLYAFLDPRVRGHG